jgi:membrane fusion protein, multidrug efflux system
MAFSRRTLSLATLLVLLAAAGAGVWWRLRSDAPPSGEAQAATSDTSLIQVEAAGSQFSTDLPQPVSGVAVIRDTLWITVNAAGRAASVRRTTLNAQVEGVLQHVPVRENSRVAAGDVLVRIDTTEIALGVAQARSDLQSARAEFQRITLFDDEITDPEVRALREQNARVSSGLVSAEVRLRQEELRLERATVHAPFEGRIADVRVVPGQYVSAGTELLTVVDLDPIKVEVSVLEAELGYLVEGRRARVTFAAFPGEEFVGRIETINPVVDPEQRTGRVTVLLNNPGGRIKPGMYAEVSLDARSYPDRILVPRSAILERGEGTRRTMLFVYEPGSGEGGLAKWRYVTTGAENERLVEIVPGDEGIVEPGEIVLVDGHHYLAHDTRIRLVESVVQEGGRPGR